MESQEGVKSMDGNVTSAETETMSDALPSVDINELIKSRLEAHRKKYREDVDSELKSIETKSRETSLSPHDPLHPDRPYGLPEEMEGIRSHIWDLILEQLNDLDLKATLSLREVCIIFRDLLKRKYDSARLPKIVDKCFENQTIPITYGSKDRVSNWVKTLSSLRTLSRISKESVDILFDRGLLKDDWFDNCLEPNNYAAECWRVPTFTLGALESEEQRKFLETLETPEDCFPRAIHFYEGGLDIFSFQDCLEKIGSRITSFRYTSVMEGCLAYNVLRLLVAHLPNLEQLMVTIPPRDRALARIIINYSGNAPPFPTCPRLKIYAEGGAGFELPVIIEIIRANPTIQEILLAKAPSSIVGMKAFLQVLDTLAVKKFHCTCTPTIAFLEHRFKWAKDLTTFALWDQKTTWHLNVPLPQDIPSNKLFDFISSFENLTDLFVSSVRLQDKGGYLQLPKLEMIYWKIVPRFSSLEFLKPAEKLDFLMLDVCSNHPEINLRRRWMKHLREYNIPSLFPALRGVWVGYDWNITKSTWDSRRIWKP